MRISGQPWHSAAPPGVALASSIALSGAALCACAPPGSPAGLPRPATAADGGPVAAADAPASRFLSLLPDGETKRRFILDCTGCHQFDAPTVGVDGRFRSQADWQARTAQMLSFAGAHTGFPVISPGRQAASTAAWLARALGDETTLLPEFDPPRLPLGGRLRERPGRVVFTEFDLGAADLPHDLALDPEGRVVVTGQLSGRMYVLDPRTGELVHGPMVPVAQANPRALEIDAEGTWWVLLGGPERIARHDPSTGEWKSWDIGMHPHSIVREPGGRLWFNGHFTKNPERIGVLDPSTGHVRTFDVPVPPMEDGGTTMPYGLRRAPDGTLWGTQLIGNRLVKFEPRSGEFTLYELPTPVSGPRRPDVAPDGAVWIPQYAASKLARFDPVAESFEEYELPVADALPYVVRVDAERGWVWVATAAADALLRFFPEDQRWEVHPLPTPHVLVRHMALDPADGTLWLSYANFPPRAPKIVRVEVR